MFCCCLFSPFVLTVFSSKPTTQCPASCYSAALRIKQVNIKKTKKVFVFVCCTRRRVKQPCRNKKKGTKKTLGRLTFPPQRVPSPSRVAPTLIKRQDQEVVENSLVDFSGTSFVFFARIQQNRCLFFLLKKKSPADENRNDQDCHP